MSTIISHADQATKEEGLRKEGVVQPGIGFPSPSLQTHLLVVRLNLALSNFTGVGAVKEGLNSLCRLFAAIDSGKKTIDVLNHETGRTEQTNIQEAFHFSATVGFGQGFFDLLDNLRGEPPDELRRPRNPKTMPDHKFLGDVTPYSLAQTDLILQLGSSSPFANRWVLENTLGSGEAPVSGAGGGDVPSPTPPDIVTAVAEWATVADVHAGFQRTEGRNLMGFNDGVSNPRALSRLFDEVVWSMDEHESLMRCTYMVFQKIVHDLDQWRELDSNEQEKWVGRSKGTGLLLGTLPEGEDDELAAGLRSQDQEVFTKAFTKWKRLFKLQSHPDIRFFSPNDITGDLRPEVTEAGLNLKDLQDMAERINCQCPDWSHVRKVNPRNEAGHIMFRRGYPFMESSLDNKLRSGLLFISFQDNIPNKFEFIKTQWAGFTDFPKLDTGREGLAGPSQHGAVKGAFLATVPLGGGYYFVPPIPKGGIEEIGQQFFEPEQPTGQGTPAPTGP